MFGPVSAADTAGIWQTTSSPGGVRPSSFRRSRHHGAYSNTLLSYDGVNALNIIYHHTFPSELAEIVPLVVLYAANLYAREPPKILFVLDGGGLEVVEQGQEVQHGYNLDAVFSSAGSL